MSLFCWTQRKIFWRMWETEQFWGTIDFNSIFFFYYGSQWCPKTAWLQTFFKLSSFVFGRTNKFIQVWNYLRVSKWWQKFNFWVNCPFNAEIRLKVIVIIFLVNCTAIWVLSAFSSFFSWLCYYQPFCAGGSCCFVEVGKMVILTKVSIKPALSNLAVTCSAAHSHSFQMPYHFSSTL